MVTPFPLNTPPVPLKSFVLIFFESGSVVWTSDIMRPGLVMLSPYMENLFSMLSELRDTAVTVATWEVNYMAARMWKLKNTGE